MPPPLDDTGLPPPPPGSTPISDEAFGTAHGHNVPYATQLPEAPPPPPPGSIPIPDSAFQPPPRTSAALLHGAERGILPGAATWAGAGYGAETGALIGTPLGLIGSGVGAVIGGLAGGIGAGWGASELQEKALEYLPNSVKKFFGQDEETRAAEQAAHPYATQIGEILPNFLAAGPSLARAPIREGATALERYMSHPAAGAAIGAGLMGGQEALNEEIQQGQIDPTSVAIAAGSGALMSKPNEVIGKRLEGYGAGAARAVAPEELKQRLDAIRNPPPPPATGEVIPPDNGPPQLPPSSGGGALPPPTITMGPEGEGWTRVGEGMIPPDRRGFTMRPGAPAASGAHVTPEAGAQQFRGSERPYTAPPQSMPAPPRSEAPEEQTAKAERDKLSAEAAAATEPQAAAAAQPAAPTPTADASAELAGALKAAEADATRPAPTAPQAESQPTPPVNREEAPPQPGSPDEFLAATQPKEAPPREETPPAAPAPTPQMAAPGAPVQEPAGVAARPPIAFRSIRNQVEPAFVPSTGASFPVEYGIADINDLVTSHHDDLAPNSAYPQALQPRSRERAETEAQLAGILNGTPNDPNSGFRPELLGENPDAANGSPIIGPEGYVESGNARTIALRRAYQRGLPQAEQYRQYLAAQGYPIDGIKNPVLVRVNRAGLDMPQREQLARDLNVAPQATMSATDRAMADAQQIAPDTLRLYQGGDLFSAANRPFWNSILRQIARPAELPALTNPEGGLSPAGQRRIASAILAKAYGDPDTVAALIENPDSNIKSIGNALTDAAPAWARLRQAVADGHVPAQYDLTSPLLEAVRLIAHARDTGRNIAEFVGQRGLFGEGVSKQTEAVLSWMLGAPEWTRRYGRDKVRDALVEYAESARRQPGMLATERPSPLELTERAREQAQGASGDLFTAAVGTPGGAGTVRPGPGENRPEVQGPGPDTAGTTAPAGGAETEQQRIARLAAAARRAEAEKAGWTVADDGGQTFQAGNMRMGVWPHPDGGWGWGVVAGASGIPLHEGRAADPAQARQAAMEAAFPQPKPAGAEPTAATPETPAPQPAAAAPEPEPEKPATLPVQPTKNAKGQDVYAVQLPRTVKNAEWKQIAPQAVKFGGQYGGFQKPGGIFHFPTQEQAQRFSNWVSPRFADLLRHATPKASPPKPTVTAEGIQAQREKESPLWDIGHHLVADGEVLRTKSGRLTAPVPKTSNFTYKRARNALDGWLLNEAKIEAAGQGDPLLQRRLDRERPDNIPPATRDELNDIVFGSERPTAANRVVPGETAAPQPKPRPVTPQVAPLEGMSPMGASPPEAAPPAETTAEPVASSAKPEPAVPGTPAAPAYGAGNKVFTLDGAEAVRARLRQRMSGTQLNAGIDPALLHDLFYMAGFHVEAGARKFAEFVKAMSEDLGEWVKPYLPSVYASIREYPDFEPAKEMSTHDEVQRYLAEGAQQAPSTEAETAGQDNGPPGTIPVGDVRAGSENVEGAPAHGTNRPASEGQDGGGQPAAEANPPQQPEPEHGGEAGSGGDRQGDADRLSGGEPGEEHGVGDAGTAIRPADASGSERGESAGSNVIPFPQRPDAKVTGTNFSIEPGALAEERGRTQKARDNVAAIELAKRLVAEQRPATREEQAVLAKYVGWGGLPGAFPDSTGKFGKGFEALAQRLKDLLTEEEYRRAGQSTQFAHYTSEPVVRAMWDAVARMGFKGGTVFEPGMGIGHFLGMMPPDLAKQSRYQGIELDPLTARIAKLLYPESGIRQADFIETPIPENAFDLVIGNPPFSDTVVKADPKYSARGFMLHDYFFAKSIDSVRPGGLLGFITSAGTMNKIDDSARRYLAERAEFVGGVRLPNTAFEQNANTSVTTDILFFKKHRFGPVDLGDEAPVWSQTTVRSLPDRNGTIIEGNVSRYFTEHPEQVLGEEGFFDQLRASPRYAVRPTPETANLAEPLRAALSRLPENIIEPPPTAEEKAALDFNTAETKNGTFYVKDGRLMQYWDGAGRPVAQRGKGESGFTAAETTTIRQLIPIRDALRAVYRADLADDAAAAVAARKELNKWYDKFVADNGPINKAVITYRKPTVIQQETARNEERENARRAGEWFEEGSFDPSDMLAANATASEIARARQAERERRQKMGLPFDEGSFNPADMPDIPIIKYPNLDPLKKGGDQEAFRLAALEDYNQETGVATKRRIFTESVLSRVTEPAINSPEDSVLWSLNQFGKLDLDQMSLKLGMPRPQLIEALGDRLFRVPGTDDVYHTNDVYLSGDVVSKLDEARAAAEKDPSFERNVAALEAVQPRKLSPAEVIINLGMPWLPVDTVRDFMRDHLDIGDTHIVYSPLAGQWNVDTRSARFGRGQARWGTAAVGAHDLLEHALNRSSPKIYYRDDDGNRIFDAVATQAAQDKIEGIKQEFRRWVTADPERLDGLVNLYNDKYNRIVLRNYDGSYLTTPGIAATWRWRPHQTRVVARIVQDGNTYMAHAVGAGKTSAMIGAGMEMRRLGLVNKPMYVVPNHMLGQFAKEFYEQYPTARIMVADEQQFHLDRRKQFIADIAQQDLDAVIITHSAFKKVPISNEFNRSFIQQHVDEVLDALASLDPSDRITKKQLEGMRDKLYQRLAKTGQQDETHTFEELGIDFLFVDEAHLFRKLSFATTMGTTKGIDPKGSDMAWDLYTKTRYLDQKRPGRSAVFASGTPITNTMGELYTLSRYMQNADLYDRGIAHFDSWAQTFGDVVTQIEQTAQGTYEPVTRFSKFVNLPELYKMVGRIMDIVTSNDLAQYVTRPQLAAGGRELHMAPRTDFLDAYQELLKQRVSDIRARRGPPQKGDDILLSVINDGRLSAIDPRFVDPSLPNDPRSKLNQMLDNVHRIWEDSKNQQFYDPATNYTKELFRGPATQMIFSNLGVNGRGFSGYDWIRRDLMARGIPRSEIAFIGDYKTSVAKQRLFNDMNEGKVRILVGSVAKMGVGVNAQRRLLAIHNLDPLWYPADDEQRNGRGLRQGNLNPFLQIHDYTTKGTYDSTMWGMMARKARFIEQFFRGDPNLREMEDLGEASQYEQASAMSTTDERVIELTDMKQQLEKLERQRDAHTAEQYSMREAVRKGNAWIENNDRLINDYQALINQRQDLSGKNFKLTLGNREFTDRKEAADAIDALGAEMRPGMANDAIAEVGQLGGFPLYIYAGLDVANVKGELRAVPVATWQLGLPNADSRVTLGDKGTGAIQSAEMRLRGFEPKIEGLQRDNADLKKKIDAYTEQLKQPFTGGDQMPLLRGKIRRLELALANVNAEFNRDRFVDALTTKNEAIAPTGIRYALRDNGKGAFDLSAEDMKRPADQRSAAVIRSGDKQELISELADELKDHFEAEPEQPTQQPDIGPMRQQRFTNPAQQQIHDALTAGLESGYRDTSDDYRAYGADADNGGLDGNSLARNYVLERGKNGNEHAAIYSIKSGRVEYASTLDDPEQVQWHPAAVTRALTEPDAGFVLHHNHEDTATSAGDHNHLILPGLRAVAAHGADGNVSVIRPSHELLAWRDRIGLDNALDRWFALVDLADGMVLRRIERLTENGVINFRQANALYSDLVSRAFDSAGLTHYVTTFRPADNLNEAIVKNIIRDTAVALRNELDGEIDRRSPQDWSRIINQSTRSVEPDAALASIPDARAAASEGEPGKSGAAPRSETDRGSPGEARAPPDDLSRLRQQRFRPAPGAPSEEEMRRDQAGVMARDDRGIVQKIKDYWADIKSEIGVKMTQGALDDLAALQASEKGANAGKLLPAAYSPTVMARLTRNLAGAMQPIIGWRNRDGSFGGGVPRYVAPYTDAAGNLRGGVFETIPGTKSFLEAVGAPIAQYGIKTPWANWMIANRAARLMAEGRENNVPQEFIDKYKDIDRQYILPDNTNLFRKIRDDWRTFNKQILDLAESRGIINAESRKVWEHSDYIPFYRALDDAIGGPGKGGSGIANVRSPIKRLKGGEDKIADVYDNMIRNTTALVDRAMRNEAMDRATGLLSGTEALTPLSRDARLEMQTPEGRARLQAMGIDPDDMSDHAKEIAKALWGMLRSRDPEVVSVMKNGVAQYYKVNNPLLLRSLLTIGPRNAEGIMKLLTGARMGITRSVMWDPAFMAAHFIRMMIHGWGTTGYDITPWKTIKGAVDAFRNSASAQAIMAGGAGGAMGEFRYGVLPRDIREAMEEPSYQKTLLNTPRKIVDFIERLGRASDMAARVAAYDDAMAKGLGEAEALRRSQDVLNFTMRGDHAAMKFLASTVPFLNARMQGLYRTGRGLRENPASVLLRGGLIAAASIALWSINKDDPEYQQKEDWDKNYAWQFKIGPGEWFRLPKPFEFGAFFATLPEMIMDYMDNGDQKQFADALSANILNQLKFNPVPALVQPIIDLYANKDHFTGRPIVSPAEQGVSAPNQYGPNTSPTMIGLGQTLGISPDQAEYLVHGYGAALGGYLLAASDMVGQALGISGERADRRLSQYPVISRFLHEDPTSENRWKTALYDMEREINQMRGDVQKMRNGPEAAAYARENAAKLALYPAVKSLTANLATLRHAMVQVSQDPNLSGADKRIKLDELTAAQNRVAAQVRPLLRRYEGLPIQ